MAKRRRLNPIPDQAHSAVLETKSALSPGLGRPPIAEVAGEAAAHSALEEVTAELANARSEGRMIVEVPVMDVVMNHLVRDRCDVDEEAMDTLRESLRHRGQQTPIEVERLEDGGYGLISGWRRVLALKRLFETTGEARFETVQALIRTPDSAAQSYIAMVEENEVRLGLSYYERGRIAIKAVEQGLFTDRAEAVRALFSTASAAKRSKILAFTDVVIALDGYVYFPTQIPERLGLALATTLREQPELMWNLRNALRAEPNREVAEERRILEVCMKEVQQSRSQAPAPTVAVHQEDISPTLRLRRKGETVTLTGIAVDAALVEDLSRWLKSR